MPSQPDILVYSKKACGHCEAAKSLLQQKGVTYREINVDTDPAELRRMVERTGRRSVPQIYIGERHIGGFDDLAELDSRGELDPLLHP